MIDMTNTRLAFNAIRNAVKDEDFLKWVDKERCSKLEDGYAEYEQGVYSSNNENKSSFTEWCLMRYLKFLEGSELEKTPKPILLVDKGTFREWYYGPEDCMCYDFMEGGTVQSHLDGVGYLRFDQILNMDAIKPLLSDAEIKAEEIENPGSRFQMVFQEYTFEVKEDAN